jgi:2-keto-4-pentenoate hydratase/2-oxohepta-3-ene-1,7-dioic acid hydratase in catechol pathway
MLLMRLGPYGSERPVVRVDATSYIDVSDAVTDYDEAFFARGGLDELARLVADRADDARPFSDERIGAPIARPHQILCIGLNYSDHAAETGQAVPTEPILFTKSPNTLVGPYDDVRIPRGSTKTDWEIELGIVIGRRTSYLETDAEAKDCIAGFVTVNDVSERAFQLERSGQWSKGKSAETFNPAGPWLATPDEVEDVGDLAMWLGGERPSPTGRFDLHDDLRPLLHRALPQPVHGPRGRRPDQHRDSTGRRDGLQPPGVAATRRRHGAGDRRPRHPASARGRAPLNARR